MAVKLLAERQREMSIDKLGTAARMPKQWHLAATPHRSISLGQGTQ